MATTPEQHFAQSFQADAENLYQQQFSKLFRCIRTERMDVESDFFNFVGNLEDDDDVTTVRHGDTVWTDLPHTRRRLTLVAKDKAVPLDKNDLKRMSYDPTSHYVTSLMGYYGRWLDRKILARALGTAYAGKNGATSINVYDVGESRVMNSDGTLATAGSDCSNTTATSLTAEKLLTLGAVMNDANVPDDGERYIAVDDWQIKDLLDDSTWGGEEYKSLRNIRDGKMDRLLGFNFVVLPSSTFNLNTTDTEAFETIAWHRSAILCATGSGSYAPEIRIDERADKKYTKQIFCNIYADASRMQGPGVIKVLLKRIAVTS
jgi:hypothetical protein